MKTKKIGFIGGGNMASSLIAGLIASGHSSGDLWAHDVNHQAADALAAGHQINIADSNRTLIEKVEIIVLAVKPQVIKEVSQAIAPYLNPQQLVVSIAAGIPQRSLSHWLGEKVAIVRCMPNTPALVLTGATGLHANTNVSAEQRDLAENILRSVGVSLWFDEESQLDTVTAISGSGPAYFFLLMEAMEKTALELGMDEQTARLLVQQTALGAAKIALEASESPEQLRKRVTSPGGTTQAAIETFEQAGFSSLVEKAIKAAKDRSIEMSKQLGEC
jgi:pyrroline-5-carboxylate reductase